MGSKDSNTQMRLLRLRYDELNRNMGELKIKRDYEEYVARLRQLVERALKNAGFEQRPIWVDRTQRSINSGDIINKGKVKLR